MLEVHSTAMKLANPEPLGLNWKDPRYFDRADLMLELDRIYDICHGCRLCFNLCPSFPALFDAIDAHEDEEVAGLTAPEKERVVELCYQCKLCYVKCPYTPPHEYNLDFPRVMLRAQAVRAREHGVKIEDRFLGMPDLVGKMGTLLSPIMNLMLKSRLPRLMMEKVIGIDRRRNLPRYHGETLAGWWSRRRPQARSQPGSSKVVLFSTCTVNYNDPEVGQAAAFVLEKNGIEVMLAPQECCGMPLLDGGMVEKAAAQASHNIDRLAPLVDAGYLVVTPGPTCTYTIKNEWPELVRTEPSRRVAAQTRDLFEFLASLKSAGKLNTDFVRSPGKVAYQVPCHLKAQNIGLPARDILKLAGAEVEVIDRCSGIDGTWGLKHAYYDMSVKVAAKLIARVADPEKSWDRVVSDCPMVALAVTEQTPHGCEHPVVALARAYGYEPAS